MEAFLAQDKPFALTLFAIGAGVVCGILAKSTKPGENVADAPRAGGAGGGGGAGRSVSTQPPPVSRRAPEN